MWRSSIHLEGVSFQEDPEEYFLRSVLRVAVVAKHAVTLGQHATPVRLVKFGKILEWAIHQARGRSWLAVRHGASNRGPELAADS